VAVEVTDDTLAEGDETFTATLSGLVHAAAGATIVTGGGETATATISANDPFTVAFSSSAYSVAEPAQPLVMTVVRVGGSGAFSVNVTFADGSAAGGGVDYISTYQTVVFGVGDNSIDVSVPIVDDSFAEAAETFTATLEALVSGSSQASLGAQTSATGTILAGDLIQVQFSKSSPYVGSETVGKATFTLVRTGGADRGTDAFTVDVTFTNASATGAGVDYDSGRQTVSFGTGVNSVDFDVTITDDLLSEGVETFDLKLTGLVGPPAATIGAQDTATCQISASDPITVSLSSSTYSVDEGGGSAIVRVVRSSTSTGSFTVDVTFSDGTASSAGGTDFTSSTITAVFSTSAMFVDIAVPINDDALTESTETFTAALGTLTEATGQASKTGTQSATVSILDNDSTLVTVNDATSSESTPANGLVSVTITGQADRDVNLTCTLSPGTAVPGTANGEDYTDATFTFNFPPLFTGSDTRNILLSSDLMSELQETLSVTCAHSVPTVSNVTISRPTATATINDDDTTQISVLDRAASESSGSSNTLVSVILDNPADRNVTVLCTLSPGTATPGTGFGEDYTNEVFVITFPAGAVGPLQRGITLTGDSVAELTEALTVTCVETSSGVASVLDGTGIATITDDDAAIVNVLDTVALENATDNNLVAVFLSTAADRFVNLTCTLTPVTAVTPADYIDATFEFAYAPQESGIKTHDVVLVNDNVAEAAESFNVTCVETSGGVAEISNPVGVATISSDDISVITVLDTSTSEADNSSNAMVSVVMTVANDRTVSVSCTLAAGTASAGVDYMDESPYLFTFTPGETGLKNATVALINDVVREFSETLTVTCTETSGGVAMVIDGVATATIVDDDLSTLTVSDRGVLESAVSGNTLVEIVMGGISDSRVNITCKLMPGTALPGAGNDYVDGGSNYTFSFAPGDTGVRQASVTLFDDAISEEIETFTLQCSESTAGGLDQVLKSSGTLTITDDDTSDLTIQNLSGPEESGSSNNLLSVTLTGASDRNISVTCTLSNGTALSGDDFLGGVTETLLFVAGETLVSRTRAIALVDDNVNEATETLIVNCEETGGATSTGVTWSGGLSGTVTLFDGDTSDLAVESQNSGENGSGVGLVAVTLTGPADRTVNVTCSLVPATATAGTADGQDYTDAVFVFMFAPLSQGTQSANIVLNNDAINEATETLNVTCSETSGGVATISVPSNVVTITDDDSSVVSVHNTIADEDGPAANGLISLLITGKADRDLKLSCTPTAGTAVPGANPGEDYTDGSIDITIPAFTEGSVIGDVVLNNDNVVESSESFDYTCVETTGTMVTFVNTTATATITDADIVTISLANVTALENATSNGLISIEMSGSADRYVNVTCTLTPGTAVEGTGAGQDYTNAVFMFEFPPLTTGTKQADMLLTDDNVQELNEYLHYTCVETSGGVLASPIGTGKITVLDDDFGSLCAVNTQYGEGGGSSPFVQAQLDLASDRTVTLSYTVTAGTAGSPSDIASFTSGTLTWDPLTFGVRSANLTAVDDVLIEANETFTVTFSSPTGGPAIPTLCDVATATIVENDYLICGDGVRYAQEACDDGNLADGDGCSSACVIEPNAQCTVVVGTSSVCRVLHMWPSVLQEDDVHGGPLLTPAASGGTVTVHLEIVGDTWNAAVGTDPVKTASVLDSLSGTLGTPYAFDTYVKPTLTAAHVTRVNATHLAITISNMRAFSIDADDTVRISALSGSVLGSTANLTLTVSENMTIADTGFSLAIEGASLPCDVASSAFRQVFASDTLVIEAYGTTFTTAMWTAGANALAFYDAAATLVPAAEFAVLSSHMLDTDRPDQLLAPSSFLVTDHRVNITFPRTLPAYINGLVTNKTGTLPAIATTSGLPGELKTWCRIVFV
jgi:cysteine-rich repeat protein